MPQHKSAAKRVRQNAHRRERNRIHRSRMRTLIKKLRQSEDATEAQAMLRDTKAYLDRLASKGIIHKNKAANYKSELEQHVNALS
ncbi:MAG: 30S ribosomal protein S20 [Rhodothermales bacterium]|nr:30S ribosomal protein S20 [Rhodothermales bacterium]